MAIATNPAKSGQVRPQEVARQAARFSPSRLLLVERSEPALYTVDRELCEAWPSLAGWSRSS